MRSNLQSRLGEEGEFRAEIRKTREFVRNEKLVPRIPILYSRLGRGMRIKFIGKIIEYKKYTDIDYSITLIKLLEASRI